MAVNKKPKRIDYNGTVPQQLGAPTALCRRVVSMDKGWGLTLAAARQHSTGVAHICDDEAVLQQHRRHRRAAVVLLGVGLVRQVGLVRLHKRLHCRAQQGYVTTCGVCKATQIFNGVTMVTAITYICRTGLSPNSHLTGSGAIITAAQRALVLLPLLQARDRTQGLLDVCIELVVALQCLPQVLLHICCSARPAMACTAAMLQSSEIC